jgi:hypothetical protein
MPDGFPALLLQAEADLSDHVEVRFDRLASSPAELAMPVGQLTHWFVQTGAVGGYTSAGVTADRSKLELIGEDDQVRDKLQFLLEARNVDVRAFQILRNMIGWSPWTRTKIGMIVVRSRLATAANRRELPLPDWKKEGEAYPDASPRIGFAVEVENQGFSKSRRCLVEFERPPEPAEVVTVSGLVRRWYDVLEVGGFVLPSDSPEDDSSAAGYVNQFDEFTVEIGLLRLLASESAWSVLINIIDAYSRRELPVVRMVIE